MFGMGTNGADAGYASLAAKLEARIAETTAAPADYVEVSMTSPEGIEVRAFAYEYLGRDAPEFKDTFDLTVNQNTLTAIRAATGKDIAAPAWMMTHFKVPRALYDLYRETRARVGRLMRQHGVVTGANPEDMAKCLAWWQAHDRAGVAMFRAMIVTATPATMGTIGIPNNLFNFWKEHNGAQPPTQSMLGMGIWPWLCNNWMYVAAGAGGALVLTRVLQKRRATARAGVGRVGLTPNPKRKERREGWPVPVMVKGEKMKLYPILTIAESRRVRVDMSKARKFRVSYKGMSLGELHRSTGKNKWKAISYAGLMKYGNLLSWMKKAMVPEAPASNPRRGRGRRQAGFMSPGVRAAIDPYGEGQWEEVWDPDLKRYVVAPFGGPRKLKGMPMTKREMRRMGYKYDLYTGEKL
jgi:hypothetical protein